MYPIPPQKAKTCSKPWGRSRIFKKNLVIAQKVTCLTHAAGVNGPVDFSFFKLFLNACTAHTTHIWSERSHIPLSPSPQQPRYYTYPRSVPTQPITHRDVIKVLYPKAIGPLLPPPPPQGVVSTPRVGYKCVGLAAGR